MYEVKNNLKQFNKFLMMGWGEGNHIQKHFIHDRVFIALFG